MNEEDEAFEELAMKQGHWQHTSGWRKKQIMEMIEQAFPNPHRIDQTGMTMREYAAIKLRVPDSGADWLDDMILQTMKDEFAAKAIQSLIALLPSITEINEPHLAKWSYKIADAMLKARET